MKRKLLLLASAVAVVALATLVTSAQSIPFGQNTSDTGDRVIWCSICMQWERVQVETYRNPVRTCTESIHYAAQGPGATIEHVYLNCSSMLTGSPRDLERRKRPIRRR